MLTEKISRARLLGPQPAENGFRAVDHQVSDRSQSSEVPQIEFDNKSSGPCLKV